MLAGDHQQVGDEDESRPQECAASECFANREIAQDERQGQVEVGEDARGCRRQGRDGVDPEAMTNQSDAEAKINYQQQVAGLIVPARERQAAQKDRQRNVNWPQARRLASMSA